VSWLGGLWQRFQRSQYWKDVTWLVSGNVVAHFITLATMPVLSRLYAPSDFALLSLFTTGVGFVSLVTMRYEYMVPLPSEDADGWRICQLVLRIGILATLLLTPIAWLFRQWIAAWVENRALAPWLLLMPCTAVLIPVGVAAQGWAQRQGRYDQSGTAEAVEKGLRNASSVALRMVVTGPSGLILGSVAGLAGKVVYVFQRDLRRLLAPTGGLRRVLRAYRRLCISLSVGQLLLAGTSAIPVVFMAKRFGADTLGQFAVANAMIALPSVLLGTAVGNVYYQRAAASWNRGSSLVGLWKSTARRLVLVGVPAYLALMVALPAFVPLILGQRWHEAGAFASVLSVGALFSFATTPMDRTCLVVGAWWYQPVWHTSRLVTTGLVAWISLAMALSGDGFVKLLVVQQSVLYLVDYWSQWRFSRSTAPSPGGAPDGSLCER
jgi:O-antigen/teichoic acid export membrane protein